MFKLIGRIRIVLKWLKAVHLASDCEYLRSLSAIREVRALYLRVYGTGGAKYPLFFLLLEALNFIQLKQYAEAKGSLLATQPIVDRVDDLLRHSPSSDQAARKNLFLYLQKYAGHLAKVVISQSGDSFDESRDMIKIARRGEITVDLKTVPIDLRRWFVMQVDDLPGCENSSSTPPPA